MTPPLPRARSAGLFCAFLLVACSGEPTAPVGDPADPAGPATPVPASNLRFLPGQWSVSAVRIRESGAADTLSGTSVISGSLNERAIKETLTIGLADGTVAEWQSLVAQRGSTNLWAVARGDAAEGTFDVLEGTFSAGVGTFTSRSGSRPDGGRTRLRFSDATANAFKIDIEQSQDSGGSWRTTWRFTYARGAGTDPMGATVNACDTEEHHRFDFWLGNWNAYGPTGVLNGTNDIKSRMGGCILEENWVSNPSGTSFNMYDLRAGLWYQVWVDANGALLMLQGGWDTDRLMLTGDAGGLPQRITWTVLEDGMVRQFGESQQGGAWVTSYDLTYSLR